MQKIFSSQQRGRYPPSSMVCLTDPQGRQQQFSYSAQGDLLRRIMPGGAAWQWDYDALHRLRETIAPDGRVTLHHCKEWRHTTSRINPESGMPESGRFVRVIRDERTTWKYDVNGRLVEKQVDKGGYRPLL
ncbi:hypothetical protein LZ633_19290 [Enterobacter asburiae]|nr:hypothetical protein [Enterobacter asburiae]